VVHLRNRLESLNERVGDQVGEGGLRKSHGTEVAVENRPVLFKSANRKHAEGRRRRKSEALFHVLDDLPGHAAKGFGRTSRRGDAAAGAEVAAAGAGVAERVSAAVAGSIFSKNARQSPPTSRGSAHQRA
jgi:hypothetical protein